MDNVSTHTTRVDDSKTTEAMARKRAIACSIKSRWRTNRSPDALAAFAAHPELRLDKLVAVDLAYEEFCQRTEAGESVDVDSFCDNFPAFRRTLRRLLSLHRFIDDSSFSLGHACQPLSPGQVFRNLEILEELGKGAFSTVYLARQLALGNRLVAIKVSVDAGDEADSLGRLSHPNIVPVYSIETDRDNGCSVICMPYLGRATLSDAIDLAFSNEKSSPKPSVFAWVARNCETAEICNAWKGLRILGETYLEAVVQIGVHLADALSHAHSRGIVHRDLKPSNVLLSFDGLPMILDFNLSADSSHEIQTIGGTVPYMSPEQITAFDAQDTDSSSVDARSDVFAVGAILYELLSGFPPFDENVERSSTRWLECHLEARRRFNLEHLRKRIVECDDSILKIIFRCLQFEPSDRPQSALELRKLLERQLLPSHRLRRWSATHPRLTGACGAFLLVIGLIAGVAFYSRDSFVVRQLKLAQQEIKLKNYGKANDRLNSVILASPELDTPFIARARVQLLMGKVDLAYDDYRKAYELKPTPQLAAAKGYCMALMGHHIAAKEFYSEAIERGLNTSVVLNNLGWTLLKLGRSQEAKNLFSRSIEASPRLQPAFLNRGIVFWQESQVNGHAAPEGFADLSQAMSLGPVSGELCLYMALLYAIKSQSDPSAGQNLIENLKKAIENGYSPAAIEKEPSFARISRDVNVSALSHQQSRNHRKFNAIHTVNPDK